MTYAKQVPAAERTLCLLEALAASPAGLSAGELAVVLDISRSSLFALLNTLKARKYIEQSDNRGRYRLGPAVYGLLPARQHQLTTLLDAFHADPDLSLINETVALSRLEGAHTVIIAQQESSRPVRVVLRVGQRRPAHTTADGLVLLAGASVPDEAEEPPVLTDEMMSLIPVRKQGWAETGNKDTIEVAFPICPDGYRPTNALLVSIPAYRWRPEDEHLSTLRRVAVRLSVRLGAAVYRPYGQPATTDPLGPTTPLDKEEINRFLEGAWGARLACVRPDGSPHVVPVWYEWDGQRFWITASPNANWGAYIRHNGGVSLTIDEPWPPLRRVLIVGQARPETGEAIPGGIAGLRQRLSNRYLGRSAADVGPQAHDGWQAFCITPQKIIGQRGLGG